MKSRTILLLCSLFIVSVVALESPPCKPSQVHLSLGDSYYTSGRLDNLRLPSEIFNDNQAYLVWHTQGQCKFTVQVTDVDNKTIAFKKSPEFENNFNYNFTINQTVNASATVNNTASQVVAHNVTYKTVAYTSLLNNISYEKTYEYTIIDEHNNVVEGPVKFKLADPKLSSSPKKILFVGNLDNQARGKLTIDELSNLFKNDADKYAGIVQLGSLAFDLQDNNGINGDNFFDSIQPFSKVAPLVVAPGNRESFDKYSFFNLRVRNPLFNMTHNQYFSFNLQGIHFINLDLDYYSTCDGTTQQEIEEWLVRDLDLSNDDKHRQLWPYIVAITSKPIYCLQDGTNDTQCNTYYAQYQKWDELFHKYKVDLVISANVSAYQRLGSIYQNKVVDSKPSEVNSHDIVDASEPIYIIEGTGGNGHSAPNTYAPSGFAKFVDTKPGYGSLYIQNNTGDVRLVYEHYDSDSGSRVDYLNLIKIKSPTAKPVDPKFKGDKDNVVVEPMPTSDSQLVKIMIPIIFVIGALAGAYYWRRKKAALQDPERSALSPVNPKEYKSSKIYGRNAKDSSVAMVDLVL